MKIINLIIALMLNLIGFTTTHASNSDITILSDESIHWEALNPERGEQSPLAANLWGDRTQAGATGFLVQFKKGFSSPPHIHNVSYRGIVIQGELHNDDPQAASL